MPLSFAIRIRVLVFAAALLLLVPVAARADVPDVAQEDFARGVAAASLGDYVAASEHFRRANTAAGGSPTIHFNLGLAQAQIAGRELSAVCWLSAYLAAEPYSRLRPSIEATLDGLEEQHRLNLAALIGLYERLGEARPKAEQGHRDDAYADAARFWLRINEVERARTALARVSPGSPRTAAIERWIAEGGGPLGYNSRRYYGMFDTPHETHSQWDLVWRWAMQGSEGEQRQNAARAQAWADACGGPTLTKPQFSDSMTYVRVVGQSAAATELSGAWDVLNRLEDAIDEVITVSHIEMWQVDRLRKLGAVPWISIGSAAAIVAILLAAFFFILFDIVVRKARTVAAPVTWNGFFLAIVATPLAVLAAVYFPISMIEAVQAKPPTDAGRWLGLIVGLGFGAVFTLGAVTGAIAGMTAVLVKLSGRALPVTKEG